MAETAIQLEQATQAVASTYYDQRYSGYGLKYHTEILHWLLDSIHGRVLDAGCGIGQIRRLFPTLDYTGIDLSPTMLQRCPPGTFHNMDICHTTFFSNQFDTLICRSLLHHLENHYQGLSEMHRVLKSGGLIRFWEPNQIWFAQQVRKRTQHGDRFTHFHRSFTDTELLSDIRKYFEIDEVRYIGFLGYPAFGFPDILPVANFIPFKSITYPAIMGLDKLLEHIPLLRRWSWSLGVKAHKAPVQH